MSKEPRRRNEGTDLQRANVRSSERDRDEDRLERLKLQESIEHSLKELRAEYAAKREETGIYVYRTDDDPRFKDPRIWIYRWFAEFLLKTHGYRYVPRQHVAEYRLPADAHAEVRDAILFLLHSEWTVPWCDNYGVARQLFGLGMLAERLYVRGREPFAKRGKKSLAASRAGHVAVYGTKAERQDRDKKIRQAWLKERRSHPAKSSKGIDASIAHQFDTSASTVQRAWKGHQKNLT